MGSQRDDEVFYESTFRTARGGKGIQFEAASAEVFAVLAALGATERKRFPGRMRMWFDLEVEREQRLVELGPWLGYTKAIARITRLFGEGIGYIERRRHSGRIPAGDFRRGDDILRYEPLWIADDDRRIARSPHQREFAFVIDGEVVRSRSKYRLRRRLSVCDARFLLNLAQVKPGDVLVEPFAGIGGIVIEGKQRGIDVIYGDIDESLRIGLGELGAGWCAIWDAQALPLRDACADVIVTEPPFEESRHGAVVRAVPELFRVLRPGGRMSLLVNEPMAVEIKAVARNSRMAVREQYIVRRQGRISQALVVASAKE